MATTANNFFGGTQFNAKQAADFTRISKPVQDHLKRVYSTLLIGCFLATAAAWMGIFGKLPGIFQYHFLNTLAVFGLTIALSFMDKSPRNENKRFGVFSLLCFLMGCSLVPLLNMVAYNIDPRLPLSALIMTSLVFGSFSAVALFSPNKREFLYLGGMLLTGLNLLMFISLANMFFQAKIVHDITLYGGLAIFCLYVIFDTQFIIAKASYGDRDHIGHAFTLFLDAINIFRHILVIMAKNRSSSSSSSSNGKRERRSS